VSPTAALPAETAELVALQAAVAGRYALERELGRGGMGVVYLARDLALGRPVALKVPPPDLAARPDRRERFLRETRTAAALTHPNIVPIHAVDERDGVAFYVMGYVDGETLTERVRRTGPLPAGEVARVLQEAGWALSYAHGRGIVHRDVKADNILIERGTGRVFLTDFGIAHVAHSTLTTAGESLGTPQYMSPEQAAGEAVDARSDLYSLGIAGFFALTGRLPFEAPNAQAVLAMQVTRPAPPVAAACPGIPTRLAAAVDRCLLKDPQARWASADAFVVAVRAVEGAATGDVAPQVRNFQRFAEVTLTQLVTLYLTFPVLAFARPAAADLLIAIPLAVSAVVLLQLADRASLLLPARGSRQLATAPGLHVPRRGGGVRRRCAPETRGGGSAAPRGAAEVRRREGVRRGRSRRAVGQHRRSVRGGALVARDHAGTAGARCHPSRSWCDRGRRRARWAAAPGGWCWDQLDRRSVVGRCVRQVVFRFGRTPHPAA